MRLSTDTWTTQVRMLAEEIIALIGGAMIEVANK